MGREMSEIIVAAIVDGVRIDIEKGDAGLFYATSQDIKGLLVAEVTMEKLKAALPGAIKDIRRAADASEDEKGK
jgi:hypothetical protein